LGGEFGGKSGYTEEELPLVESVEGKVMSAVGPPNDRAIFPYDRASQNGKIKGAETLGSVVDELLSEGYLQKTDSLR